MKKHTISLVGETGGELRIAGDILAEAILALIEGAQRATRLYVEGESVRKGPRPGWLDAACRIEVTGLKSGSVEVCVEAPTLQEAVPDRFDASTQLILFGEAGRPLDVSQTSVDFFAEVLDRTVSDSTEDLLADRNLLDTCIRFAKVSGPRFEGIRLDGVTRARRPVVIRNQDVSKIERLRDETPEPRAVRLSGLLDTISATRPDIVLRLPNKTSVPARLEAVDPDLLSKLFGQQVVISGMAQFRPSGRLLVVDVEDIAPAGTADQLWQRAPRMQPLRSSPVATLVPQDGGTGVGAFFGTWPGDESDQELQRILRELE